MQWGKDNHVSFRKTKKTKVIALLATNGEFFSFFFSIRLIVELQSKKKNNRHKRIKRLGVFGVISVF